MLLSGRLVCCEKQDSAQVLRRCSPHISVPVLEKVDHAADNVPHSLLRDGLLVIGLGVAQQLCQHDDHVGPQPGVLTVKVGQGACDHLRIHLNE